MNYSKNTTTPITDAARFFNERDERVRYEDRLPWSGKRVGVPNGSKKTPGQTERIVKKEGPLRMEYL